MIGKGRAFAYFGILYENYCVCDFELKNIIKHGDMIINGFELYETIYVNSIYIKKQCCAS